jgi:glycosyltransferase involved in cell wall biosynthesis
MASPQGVPPPDTPLPVWAPSGEQRHAAFRLAYRWSRLRATLSADAVRERIEIRQDRRELRQLRDNRDVVWREIDDPLVTVRIATYSAGERLSLAIESALRQTYRNVDVLVVGDQCDDATATVAQRYAADGVRFLNLPRRGQYPVLSRQRWMVAGAAPMNVALELARGDWIAPCDDDDMLTDDHVERLLDHALRHRLEFVWSRAALEASDGSWSRTAEDTFEEGQISHGSVLYSTELRFMRYNRRAYISRRPGDWDLWRRMRRAGVKMGYLDALTYYHFA